MDKFETIIDNIILSILDNTNFTKTEQLLNTQILPEIETPKNTLDNNINDLIELLY